MKYIFTVLITLASTIALAFPTAQFQTVNGNELQYKRECSTHECRHNDGGEKFLRYCDFTRPIFPTHIGVMLLYDGGTLSCYCPCNLGFIGKMRSSY